MKWSPHESVRRFEALGGRVLTDTTRVWFGMAGMKGDSDIVLWTSLGRGARRVCRVEAIARAARARA